MTTVEYTVAAWQRDLPLRVGQRLAVNESMDNLLRHLKSAYELQDDWHAKGEEFRFSCDDENPADNTRRRELGEDYVIPRLHLTARDKKILLTLHSLKQMGKEIGLSDSALIFLLENRPNLLVENLNCLFNEHKPNKEWLLRLRLGTIAGNSRWVLRAFLDKKYNRLDSIHLVEALREFCKLKNLEFSRFAFDGNRLFLCLINTTQSKKFLTNVGDEFCSGIAIVNSEIDKENVIEVDFYFERLFCTNGMTTQHKKTYFIKKSVPLSTEFHNELPKLPLNEQLRRQICEYVVGNLKMFFSQLPAAQKSLESLSRELSERSFKDAAEAITEMLRRMEASRTISAAEVLEYIVEERRDFTAHQNNHWLIYNAILRYISHRMLIADPPIMHHWYLGRQYQRKAGKRTFHQPAPTRSRTTGPPVV